MKWISITKQLSMLLYELKQMPSATSYPTQSAYGTQYGVLQQVPQQAAGGYTLQGAGQQQTYY